MATHEAFRAANKPGPDHAERVVEEVRQEIAAEPPVLKATRDRRNDVLVAANQFNGALDTFPSGSLAHGTVNNPVSDGDGGVILDRRSWPDLGPDGRQVGPDTVMRQMGAFILAVLQPKYPKLTCTLIKRALVFEFHEPMDDEDPSVDLVDLPDAARRAWLLDPQPRQGQLGRVAPPEAHPADDGQPEGPAGLPRARHPPGQGRGQERRSAGRLPVEHLGPGAEAHHHDHLPLGGRGVPASPHGVRPGPRATPPTRRRCRRRSSCPTA